MTTKENTPLQDIVEEAVDGMRTGLQQVIEAKVASLLHDGGLQRVAEQVFNSTSGYGIQKGENWIQAELRRSIEKRCEDAIAKYLDERADELTAKVREELLKTDIAGQIALKVTDKIKVSITNY